MNYGSYKRNMAHYSHVHAIPIPQRNYRQLRLCEVASLVMRVEIRTIEFWRAVISECLGTMFYVLLGCSSTLSCENYVNYQHNILLVSLAFGFTMATLVQCFGHISGAHFNPVVSLAMTVTCKVTPLRGILYCIAQMGGAIAGAALLYGITPALCHKNLGLTQPNSDLSPWQALGIEVLLTFLFVFAIFATIDPNRKELGSKALAIGIALGLCHLAGYRFTGSSLNPARSLGPAFVLNTWKNHWIYWAGPMMGGLVSGILYEYIFDPSRGRRRPQITEDTSNYPDIDDEELSVPTTQTPTSNHVTHTYGNQSVSTYTSHNHVTSSPPGPTPSEEEPASPDYRPGGQLHVAGAAPNQVGGMRRPHRNYLPVDTNPNGLENHAYSFDTNPRRIPPPPPPRSTHVHTHVVPERGEEILMDDVRPSHYQPRQA